MNSIGEIIELDGGNAVVKFKRGKACKNCNACLSFSDDELIVQIKNTLDAKIGDKVEIVLHARSVIKASLIAYGIPIITLIAGALSGSLLGDLYTAIFGILGAGTAFVILRLLEPRFERMSDFQPRMLSIVYDENKCD